MRREYIQGVKQLEERIKKLDLTYKHHKEVYDFSKLAVTILIIVCLFFAFKEANFLFILIGFLLFGNVNAQAVMLKQERALIGNLQEWCVYLHNTNRKDIAINNLTEMFFTLKEDLRDKKIRRGKLYDKALEMSKLINNGRVVHDDCLDDIENT